MRSSPTNARGSSPPRERDDSPGSSADASSRCRRGPQPHRRSCSRARMTITWRELLRQAEDTLGSPVDARRIVERVAGEDVLVRLDEPATERGVGFFDLMLERRSTGEPLQYVVGQWGFRTLDLFVDKRVLIPRPETETVVEVALRELRALGER